MAVAAHERVVDYLAGQSESMVWLLRQLTLAESPSHEVAAQDAIKSILAAEFEALGFTVRSLPGPESGGSLLAYPRNRTRHQELQMLLGHFDTVWPSGTLNDMPFEVDGNIVRGPGVFE